MTTGPMGDVLRRLRGGDDRTDAELLADYAAGRDEAALAAVVRRHGPMVWGVCRRALGGHHDAEEAFQATFLVLARKAGTLAATAAPEPRRQVFPADDAAPADVRGRTVRVRVDYRVTTLLGPGTEITETTLAVPRE